MADGERAGARTTPLTQEGEPAARQPPVAPVGLELLPSTGYPAPRVRGIQGGSLWLTMQGWQFPYMPRIAGTSATRLAFSGTVWSDTSYRKVDSGIAATDPSVREQRQQSRLVLRATPTFNTDDDWFVQGQGELALIGASPALATDSSTPTSLRARREMEPVRRDHRTLPGLGGLSLRHGARSQHGRAQRRHHGEQHARSASTPDLPLDRPNGPGYVAAHVYPTDYLRFELLGEWGARRSTSSACAPWASWTSAS